MACAATLKRSLEFDPVHSPSHNAKRRRCMPVTLTPTSPPAKCQRNFASPFSGVAQKLTSEQIAVSLTQEMKRMQRRRQLHYPAAVNSSPSATATPEKADEGPSRSTSPDNSPLMSQSLSNLFSSMPYAKRDVPLFTFRQVSLICERMVRDREEEVKEQYDKVLNCKLAEQYEAFLKFNHDQLHMRFGHSEMSYSHYEKLKVCFRVKGRGDRQRPPKRPLTNKILLQLGELKEEYSMPQNKMYPKTVTQPSAIL